MIARVSMYVCETTFYGRVASVATPIRRCQTFPMSTSPPRPLVPLMPPSGPADTRNTPISWEHKHVGKDMPVVLRVGGTLRCRSRGPCFWWGFQKAPAPGLSPRSAGTDTPSPTDARISLRSHPRPSIVSLQVRGRSLSEGMASADDHP